MILLFGDRATKSSSAKKNSNVKQNNPVENSGILAMNLSTAKSILTVGEYDTYVSSNPYAVDYAMYSDCTFEDGISSGFMSDFSAAVAVLGTDCGSFDCGSAAGSYSAGASCSSFTSVG